MALIVACMQWKIQQVILGYIYLYIYVYTYKCECVCVWKSGWLHVYNLYRYSSAVFGSFRKRKTQTPAIVGCNFIDLYMCGFSNSLLYTNFTFLLKQHRYLSNWRNIEKKIETVLLTNDMNHVFCPSL